MEIEKLTFPKSALSRISPDEAVVFFHFGHLHNEILLSYKLTKWAWHRTEQDPASLSGQVAFFISIFSRFAGQLYETWRAVEKTYFGTGLAKSYSPLLNEEGQKALKQLKRYFGKKNLIKDIRDGLSNHYDSSHILDRLKATPLAHEYVCYVGDFYTNTLFDCSHTLNAAQMLQMTGATAEGEAVSVLSSAVLEEVASPMMTFLTAVLAEVLRKIEPQTQLVALSNVPDDNSLSLPFFTTVQQQQP